MQWARDGVGKALALSRRPVQAVAGQSSICAAEWIFPKPALSKVWQLQQLFPAVPTISLLLPGPNTAAQPLLTRHGVGQRKHRLRECFNICNERKITDHGNADTWRHTGAVGAG